MVCWPKEFVLLLHAQSLALHSAGMHLTIHRDLLCIECMIFCSTCLTGMGRNAGGGQ